MSMRRCCLLSAAAGSLSLAALALTLPPAGAQAFQLAGRAAQEARAGTPAPPEVRELPLLETILERALRERLGPAERWQILVTATDEERAAGRPSKVEIRGTNLRLPDGLKIALVELILDQVNLDLQGGGLRRSGEAILRLRIRPDDMADLIEKKSKGKLRGVRIRMEEDRIVTRGKLKLGFLSLGLSRQSEPEIRNNAVYARTYRMVVGGIGVTKKVETLEAKINPVVDLDQLRVPVRLDKLRSEKGELVLEVSVDLAAPLRTDVSGEPLRGRGKGRKKDRDRERE